MVTPALNTIIEMIEHPSEQEQLADNLRDYLADYCGIFIAPSEDGNCVTLKE